MPDVIPVDDGLLDLASGYAPTFLLRAALRLRIAEALGDRAASTADLARATGTHEPSLRRVLRALAALDVLAEAAPDAFRLTPRGQLLRPDVPGSMHGVLTVGLDDAMWDSWPALDDAVRTGRSAFELVHETDYATLVGWADRESSPRREVDEYLIRDTRAAAAALLAAVDLAGFATVVDIGGGSGPLLAAVLSAYPQMRGVLLDQGDGAALAPDLLAAAGVADRVTIDLGDFEKHIPAAELYLCKSVLFNWADDAVVGRLLANCRAGIAAAGRLLLIEQVLPATVDGSVPATLYVDDVASIATLGGRWRTEPEYRALLAAAGFAMSVRALPGAPRGYVLVEAAPV